MDIDSAAVMVSAMLSCEDDDYKCPLCFRPLSLKPYGFVCKVCGYIPKMSVINWDAVIECGDNAEMEW